jgi:hypothetical protein
MLKGKAVPLYDNQAQSRGTGIALPILDFSARREWVISAMLRPLYPLERDPVPIVHRTLSAAM